MDFVLQALNRKTWASEKTDALLVLVDDKTAADLGANPDAISALIAQAEAAKDLSHSAPTLLSCYRPAGIAAKRVYLLSVGKGQFNPLRKHLADVLADAKTHKAAQLSIALACEVSPAFVTSLVGTLANASYRYTATLTKPDAKSALSKCVLRLDKTKALQQAFDLGVATAKGQLLAREWANRPGNVATPTALAQASQELVKGKSKLSCEVLDAKAVKKLKMGAFMGVAQGSDEPLQFIVLRYQGAAASVAPHVLVGKGITFDTGGISIKPAAEMDEMKFDMGGAASVLGVFESLGHLQPKINVIGLIPACENMPSGKAIKPGDVLTSMDGQTIEVLNTDAEGRLILCDALTYAKRFKPKAVIDIATLTGACVIALGAHRSGLFANNDALAAALQEAGEASADPCWRMPLDDEYAEGLKSNFADVANVSGRAAGSVTAAKFLQRFVGDMPWAHLDIAGTAWKSGGAKGATGRPVPLLVQYLMQQAERS